MIKNYTISVSVIEFHLRMNPVNATHRFVLYFHKMEIRTFEFGSATYKSALELRDEILRKPLGMSIFKDNLEGDRADFHIGAFQNNQLMGCLILHPMDNGEIKMRQVAVQSRLQSAGIGKAMVQFAESFAIEKNHVQMVLHARKVVVGFYQKLGYSTEGEEFTEVGIPHFRMSKNLLINREN